MRDTKQEILQFWFEEIEPQQWFLSDPTLDTEIKERFGITHEMAAEGLCNDWIEDPEGCLALVILLDQFPRHIYRGTSRMLGTDEQALVTAKKAVYKGFDKVLDYEQRRILYLPFQHSENLADQETALQLYKEIAESYPEGEKYAQRHYDIIKRFGRFPHRNQILGRESTSEEIEFLKTYKERI